MTGIAMPSHRPGLPTFHYHMRNHHTPLQITHLKTKQAVHRYINKGLLAIDGKRSHIVRKWPDLPGQLMFLRIGDIEPPASDIIEVYKLTGGSVNGIMRSLIYADLFNDVPRPAIDHIPKSILQGGQVHREAIRRNGHPV